MWRIVQQNEPDDFVIATGESHTVREFVERAFAEVGMRLDWRGDGADEVALVRGTNRIIVAVDPRYFRPTEVDTLLGDPTKARERLGWRHRTSFAELVAEMVQADLELVGREAGRRIRNLGD